MNVPAGVRAGDLLLAQVTVLSSSTTITLPGGWTQIRRDNNATGNLAQAIYWRIATASEPASYSWSFGATARQASGAIVAYAGVDTPSPILTSSNLALSLATSTPQTNAVATTANNSLLVSFFGFSAPATWTAPGGTTALFQRSGGATSSFAADQVQALAGASLPLTATASASAYAIAQTIALDLDVTAPALPALTPSESSPNALVSGSTVYYRPGGAGSFSVAASSSDAESGLVGFDYPGLTGGFTPATTTRVLPATGSLTYSWSAGASDSGVKTVNAVDRAGNTTGATFTLTPDPAAPTGQTLSLASTAVNSASVAWTTGDGSDALTGVDTATRLVERAAATLTNGACGSFGAFSGSYTSPDTSVATGNCYQYRFSIADNVGNRSAGVVGPPVLVDTSAPGAPAATVTESPASASQFASGSTLWYRPAAAGGSFQVAAAPADGQSGIASVAFPAITGLTGGATTDTTSPYAATYAWDAATAATGAQTLTATNGTGLTSTATFTLSQDAAAPTGGSVTYANGWNTTGSVSVTA
jgi:hypothetical protein